MKRAICILALILCITTAVILPSCSRAKKTPDRPLVGICVCNMMEECWYNTRETITNNLNSFGIDTIVQNANNNQEKQNEQIEYLVDLGVSAIIITPVNTSQAADSVKKARDSGVHIICFDKLVKGTEVDAYYTFDNEKAGHLLVSGLLNEMNSGHIMVINGDAQDENTNLCSKGYYEELGPYMTSELITILRTEWIENGTKEVGYNAVESALASGITLDGIIACSDSVAEMAIYALSENGLAGKTIVVGQNGDLAACQRIVEGTQAATVFKDYKALAKTAAIAAFRMIRDYPYVTNTVTKNDWGEIPTFVQEPVLVNKSNINTIVIDNGIYTWEEVYREE